MILGGILPLAPQIPPRGALGGWVYPKMKMVIIFGFPTIENPRFDITHYFLGYTPSSSPNTPRDALGVGVSLK